MTRIMVFGASITYGAWDTEGGWADRLKKFLHEKTISGLGSHYHVYNQGVSGDTSKDVLERFEFEVKQRLKENEDNIVIFSIGGNDSQFIHSKNAIRISEDMFKGNVQKLIDMAKKVSEKIVIIGLTPMDDSKTQPIPWNTDKSYKNEYIQKYNEIVRSVCKENNILFVELFDKLEDEYVKTLVDGVHPNSEGHKMMFEVIRDFLVENKII